MTATQSPGGLEATRHGNHVASSPELTPNSVSTGPVQRAVTEIPTLAIS